MLPKKNFLCESKSRGENRIWSMLLIRKNAWYIRPRLEFYEYASPKASSQSGTWSLDAEENKEGLKYTPTKYNIPSCAARTPEPPFRWCGGRAHSTFPSIAWRWGISAEPNPKAWRWQLVLFWRLKFTFPHMNIHQNCMLPAHSVNLFLLQSYSTQLQGFLRFPHNKPIN